MDLLVEVPPNCLNERRYAVETLLSDFLGISADVVTGPPGRTTISADHGGRVVVPDAFFAEVRECTGGQVRMPGSPLARFRPAECGLDVRLVEPELPVLYGAVCSDGWYSAVDGESVTLGVDVFGSAFVLLSRLEEALCDQRDAHGRFPATASLAVRHAFLHRPLVNEYAELLWACMRRAWPSMRRRRREHRVIPTHDVDAAFAFHGSGSGSLFRHLGADVLRRRDPVEACRNVVRWLKVARGRVEADPYNCFDELMTLSERHGLRSRFYMIAGDSAGALDANYGIGDPCIRALMRRIHSRGHELGLHGSYASAADPERLRAEADRLRGVCREEGIVQPRWGGRQHFLRWEPRRGASAWRAAGLEYDSSLGYTDDPGFRCGTCYQYPLFDLAERRRSGVSELPLVLMERAVAPFPAALSERELESAVTRVRTLRERCRLFDGDFVFLLHNSKYKAARHRRLYESMLGAA